MLPVDLYRIQELSAQIQHHPQGEAFWATRAALNLYRQARCRSLWTKVWSILTGQSRTLLDLDVVRAVGPLRACYEDGARSVAINRIVGSEGRSRDFDVRFRPLRSHSRERWVRIAVARLMRTPLPPVTLTLVGGRYFVVDGHHRVSVARALGQSEIDAVVTVYEFAGPLPWEQTTPVRIPAFSRGIVRV